MHILRFGSLISNLVWNFSSVGSQGSSKWCDMKQIGITLCALWKTSVVSLSAQDVIKCLNVFYSTTIGLLGKEGDVIFYGSWK